MKILKNILILLVLILGLSSCWNDIKEEEQKKHNLNNIDEKQINYNIKKLDKEWAELVIKYFKSNDESVKKELKKEIEKHMLEIQWEISNIKWETIEEKNREIQKITRKIKLYKSLGF